MPVFRPPLVEGEIYHIYNRGIDGKIIFPTDEYYERFILGLQLFNTTMPVNIRDITTNNPEIKSRASRVNEDERLVDLGLFNLRPTHHHLLLRQVAPDGISLFMQKNGVGFTSFFNLKNSRKGPVFQGTFRAKLVDSDRYLKHIFAYIILNTLDVAMPEWRENGIVDRKKAERLLIDYKWSNFGSLFKKDNRFNSVVSKNFVEEFFDDVDELKEFVLSWGAEESDLVKEMVAG